MKKSLLIISSIVLISALILALLVRSAKMPNEGKNGFDRKWLTNTIRQVDQIAITAPLETVCGATANHFFFTVPNPQWVVMIGKELQKQDTFFFPVWLRDELLTTHNIEVDSPYIYLYANNALKLFRGQINGKTVDSVRLKTSLFTRSVHISPKLAVLRAFDASLKRQVFEKMDTRTGKIIKQDQIIETTGDAGFSTDGSFTYDSSTRRIFYVEYYTNHFFCLDTSLNIIYKANTIDTTQTNDIGIKIINHNDQKRVVPSLARIEVNKECCVSNGYLLVVSGLKADNEKRTDFKNNSVIDIYRVSNGKYTGSLYIPDIQTEKIKSLRAQNNLLVALYKSHIATYALNL